MRGKELIKVVSHLIYSERMSHSAKILLFLCLFLLGSPSLFAADCKLKTGVNEDAAFFKRDFSGRTSGFSWDILQEITRRTGCEFMGMPMNFVRALEEFKNSRLDMYAIVSRVPGWEKVADHQVLFASERVVIFRREGVSKGSELTKLLKDKSIKFANIIGTVLLFNDEEKKQLEKAGRIIDFPNAEAAVSAVRAGRVQAMFVSPLYLQFLRKAPDFDKLSYAYDFAYSMDIGIYISRMRMTGEHRKMIEKAIRDMRSDGTIKKILGEYLQAEDLSRYH